MVNKFPPSGPTGRLRGLVSTLGQKAREPIDLGRTAARIALRSGLLWDTGPQALGALARERLCGPLGPGALVTLHAAGRPDAPALADGDRRLSYRELDVRAGRLARQLKERLDVRPKTAVALVLKNRLETIEAQTAL